MSLLLSNDDGVHAPGLAALTKVLSDRFEVMVVAPDRDHSGASSALTLSRPLKVTRVDQHVFAVDGTPADSAHLGITSICQDQGFSAERVISGINSHENLGDDVLYSGTVAAAIEGRFLSLSPLAVSLVNRGDNHFDTAAKVALDLLDRLGNQTFPANTILNINVPDVPYNALKGTRVTRLGHRAKGLPPEKTIDPRGRERYWIALAGDGEDAGEGTDFWAVEHGYVSLTPIQVDMTAHQAVDTLKTILQ